jgi:hypothetical protein
VTRGQTRGLRKETNFEEVGGNPRTAFSVPRR